MATTIVGIVNLTEDSFSDGGRYLAAPDALEHAAHLEAGGASVLDLGPASSHPDSIPVSAEEEIRRLAPVLDRLLGSGGDPAAGDGPGSAPSRTSGVVVEPHSALSSESPLVSVDSCLPETQRYALARGVHYLNDIRGFSEPRMYDLLAAHTAKLVVMFSLEQGSRAVRRTLAAGEVIDRMWEFFRCRVGELERAGVDRSRIVLDPGMGFFLGDTPEPSLAALRALPRLREDFGLETYVSVSRKSFLGAVTGSDVADRGAATLAAELYAADQGVTYIRTHDAGALRDALAVREALRM